MLTIVPITKNYLYFEEVKRLYKESFPQKERDSLRHLLTHSVEGIEFVALEKEGAFCGFAFLMTYQNLTHILYFAIEENLRHHGYGSEALLSLHEWKKDNKIIVDVEVDDKGAHNLTERKNRILFYLHNGYQKTNIQYSWNGVHYELLSFGGDVSEEEFDAFWEYFEFSEDMGKFLYESFKHTPKQTV